MEERVEIDFLTAAISHFVGQADLLALGVCYRVKSRSDGQQMGNPLRFSAASVVPKRKNHGVDSRRTETFLPPRLPRYHYHCI